MRRDNSRGGYSTAAYWATHIRDAGSQSFKLHVLRRTHSSSNQLKMNMCASTIHEAGILQPDIGPRIREAGSQSVKLHLHLNPYIYI